MISDVLADAISDIESYQTEMPESYAGFGVEIDIVKVVMEGMQIILDSPPGQSDEFENLVEEQRSAIRVIDVARLVATRDRLWAWVQAKVGISAQQPQQDELDLADLPSHGWQPIGAITIDSAKLLLIDPIHQGRVDQTTRDGQIEILGGDYSAVQVPTGIGDGRYRVEGRVLDSPVFGHRLAEIRVQFLDADGNWLGGD